MSQAVPVGRDLGTSQAVDGMRMRRSWSRAGAPADDRLRSLLAVAVLVCGFVTLAWVTTSGSPLRWNASRPDVPPLRLPSRLHCPRGTAPTDAHRCRLVDRPPSRGWDVLAWLVEWIGTVALVFIATALVMLLWRSRPQRRQRESDDPGPAMTFLPGVADVIAEDAEAQLEALREGSPRNAIVACWMRLERSIEAAGLPVRPSDTSEELVVRALSRYPLDPQDIKDLAALYREARFSDHEITEPMRQTAFGALSRLHAGLGRYRTRAGIT
jgi:hypothetical protein